MGAKKCDRHSGKYRIMLKSCVESTYSNIPKRQNLEIEVNRIENIGNDEQEVK